MVNLGGIGSYASNILFSWGFWLLMAVAIFFVVIGSLWMRKKGKFIFPCLILIPLGNGKYNFRKSRAGWFKSKKTLGGLIELTGEKRLEVKDGRMVQKGDTTNFHELDFKSGLIVMEKADDPKILVPVNKFNLTPETNKLLLEIAPSGYRDACSRIIADGEKESANKWETIAQVLVFGLVAIVLFISIILTIQYAKNTMAEANQIHKDALSFYQKVLDRMSAVPATNAP